MLIALAASGTKLPSSYPVCLLSWLSTKIPDNNLVPGQARFDCNHSSLTYAPSLVIIVSGLQAYTSSLPLLSTAVLHVHHTQS